MTKEVYESKLAELKADYAKKSKELLKKYNESRKLLDLEFATAMTKYVVGDKVKDRFDNFYELKSIQDVRIGVLSNEVYLTFTGVEISKKTLLPKKNQKLHLIDETDIEEIIKKGKENESYETN